MKRKTWHSYAKSHNLVNRIYDMLDYFGLFNDHKENEKKLKKQIYSKMGSFYYIENLAKYFDEKLKRNQKNIEIRCNLKDLLYDLDILKQYLVK
jgi:hypothetical protein